jgi:hypothetical protein
MGGTGMKSLQELYAGLLQKDNPNNCFYYGDIGDHVVITDAKSFIENYFEKGGKRVLIHRQELLINPPIIVAENNNVLLLELMRLESMRYEHMKSAFLLGVLFYNEVTPLRNSINEIISRISYNYRAETGDESETERQRFLYMWYLICLYHDFGYLYEKEEKNKIPKDKHEIISTINHDFFYNNIKGCSTLECPFKHCPNREISRSIPKTLQRTISRYFQLRLNCFAFNYPRECCIDHGDASSINMYNTMKQLHEDKWKNNDGNDGLKWHPKIFQHYIIPAVWTIACHNIWLAEKGTPQENHYSTFGLGELIYSRGDSLIDMQHHPLLFLLSLVDTIEPLKKYMKENYNDNVGCNGESVTANNNDNTRKPEDILSSVTASFTNNKLRFKISPPLPSSACRSKCEYHKDTKKCTRYSCHKSIQRGLSFLESPLFQVSVDDQYLNLTFTDL